MATTPGPSDASIDLETARRRTKDYDVALEYKFLINSAPTGVYMLPQINDIRKLHGVIFVSSSHYKDGVFRFRIDLPNDYNSLNSHPLITFTPPVFCPLIDMSTGKLELTADESFTTWNPDRHHLLHCLQFVKGAFFDKNNYSKFDVSKVPNPEALNMFNTNRKEFTRRAELAVKESIERLYDQPGPSSSLVFSEPKPVHEEIVRSLYRNFQLERELFDAENEDFNDETHDDTHPQPNDDSLLALALNDSLLLNSP